MVITRTDKSEDLEALEWLEELKVKGASDEDIEAALADYESHVSEEIVSPKEMFEIKKEAYKKEKSVSGFESGVGGFKRSS